MPVVPIYLDIDDKRKRIGDVIVVNTLNDLMPKKENSEDYNWKDHQPNVVNEWSVTALYYVTEANALLKWTGSEWKQINSYDQIDLTEIQGQVDELSGKVESIEDAIGNKVNVSDYQELAGQVATKAEQSIVNSINQQVNNVQLAGSHTIYSLEIYFMGSSRSSNYIYFLHPLYIRICRTD